MDYSIEAIVAELGQVTVQGDARPRIRGFASLGDAGEGDLSFLASLKYRADLAATKASAILVPTDLEHEPQAGQVFLRVEDPSLALAVLCESVEAAQRPRPETQVHETAVVDPLATVDPSAYVGPGCVVAAGSIIGPDVVLEAHAFVGRGAKVGEGSYLHPRAIVHDYCVLGSRVRLQPGVVVGGDGFGYLQTGGQPPNLRHRKVPQIGIVVIEDDVEIGANSTIDRARFGETRIGTGTKIDNLVQIAHNVRIGQHCIICAQVGISGSTTVGDYVVLWGQVGVAGHLHIGDGAFVGAQAGIAKDVPAGAKVTGTPARPLLDMRRAEAAAQRLPDFMRRVDKELNALNGGVGDQ